MRARPLVVVAVLAACLIGAASPAHASEQFGDLDVSFVSLKVDDHGEALVTYRTATGVVRHVYVWGAITNATATMGRLRVPVAQSDRAPASEAGGGRSSRPGDTTPYIYLGAPQTPLKGPLAASVRLPSSSQPTRESDPTIR